MAQVTAKNVGPKKSAMLVQVSMGDYRNAFVQELLDSTRDRFDITLVVGDQYFGGTTVTSRYIRELHCRKRPVNILIGNSIGIQLFNYWQAVQVDALVLELNPRLLHTWILLLVRKVLGRKTVLWGHIWARSGPGSSTEKVRAVLRNLADGLLFYTEDQKQSQLEKLELTESGRLFVAPNSLYSRKAMVPPALTGLDFIYVGRLVPEKKPNVLVEAFIQASDQLDQRVKLHIVGAGPLSQSIGEMVSRAGMKKRIIMHGHVGDYDRLRDLYSLSIFSVSPGYVGLSATQSLSYGRPMLVSRDEPHAPEICALQEDMNCVYFETDNIKALGEALVSTSGTSECWEKRFEQIASRCRDEFSVETMVEGFVSAIEIES